MGLIQSKHDPGDHPDEGAGSWWAARRAMLAGQPLVALLPDTPDGSPEYLWLRELTLVEAMLAAGLHQPPPAGSDHLQGGKGQASSGSAGPDDSPPLRDRGWLRRLAKACTKRASSISAFEMPKMVKVASDLLLLGLLPPWSVVEERLQRHCGGTLALAADRSGGGTMSASGAAPVAAGAVASSGAAPASPPRDRTPPAPLYPVASSPAALLRDTAAAAEVRSDEMRSVVIVAEAGKDASIQARTSCPGAVPVGPHVLLRHIVLGGSHLHPCDEVPLWTPRGAAGEWVGASDCVGPADFCGLATPPREPAGRGHPAGGAPSGGADGLSAACLELAHGLRFARKPVGAWGTGHVLLPRSPRPQVASEG